MLTLLCILYIHIEYKINVTKTVKGENWACSHNLITGMEYLNYVTCNTLPIKCVLRTENCMSGHSVITSKIVL